MSRFRLVIWKYDGMCLFFFFFIPSVLSFGCIGDFSTILLFIHKHVILLILFLQAE